MDYTRQRAFESRDYLPYQIVQRLKKDRQSRTIYTEMPGWDLGPVIANDVPTKDSGERKTCQAQHTPP